MSEKQLMFCPVCQREGNTSSINLFGAGVVTDMATRSFIDEKGHSHFHDPNAYCEGARCSNGHQLSLKITPGCAIEACEFGVRSVTLTEIRPRGTSPE